MQEIKKRTILLTSVLKPADEPRMYERMGQSLAANGYEVFIAGFPPTAAKPIDGIHFLPHNTFNRISFSRITVRFKILRKVLSIKPDLLIICTHELIGVGLLYRLFTGKRIIYDVQENYFRNILYTDAWPKFIRPFLAFAVRLKEIITFPFISQFLLAEKCYHTELTFTKGKNVIIENKCRLPQNFQRKSTNDLINLIFTGTIAESTGVFQAMELTKKLHAADHRIRLLIIGYCAQPKTLERVKDAIVSSTFISLIGGDSVVPHTQIMEAISTAHFGIVFYPRAKNTENRIPSKLYEYLACRLPMLIQEQPQWIDLCKPYSACIIVDPDQPDVSMILKQMTSGEFYLGSVENANWVTEEAKLLDSINSIR
jgi:hypothetical protein